jgi:hypothetical protein
MGLKGYRLWVMGQLDSTCRAPPRRERFAAGRTRERGRQVGQHLDVAVQVGWILKQQTLKPPGYHFICSRVAARPGGSKRRYGCTGFERVQPHHEGRGRDGR